MIINLPKLGDVEFPDNVTPQQLNGLLGKLADKYDFTLPKPEASLGTIAKRGFMRSLGETGIALGDLAPAMLNEFIGGDRAYTERQMGEAQQTRESLEEKYPTRFRSYKNIDSPFQAIEYGAETLGELAPTALTTMIPGAGAGTVASRLATRGAMRSALEAGPLSRAGMMAAEATAKEAGQVAGRRAMYAGNYMGSFAQNVPEVFEGIYQETGKFEPGIAALAGGISSVLDSVVPTKVMDQLGTYGKLKLVEKLAKDSGAAPNVWKRIGIDAAKTAATEGLTESAQEAIGAYAEEIAGSSKDLLHPENIQRFKEAFVKGAIGGAGFAVPEAVSQYRTIKRDQFTTKEAQEALAQQEQQAQQQAQQPTAIQQQVMNTVQAQPGVPRTQEELEQAFRYTQEELGILQKRMDASRPGSPAYAELDAAIKAKQTEADKISQEKAKLSAFSSATPNEQGMYSAQQPVDAITVKSLGVNPTSKAGQAITGLDLNTPEGVTTLVKTLEDPGFKGSINEAAYNTLISTLDPTAVAEARKSFTGAQNVAGLNAQPSGKSTGVVSQPSGGQPTAGSTAPQPDGVVSTGQDVEQPAGGEGQPTTPIEGATTETSKRKTAVQQPPVGAIKTINIPQDIVETDEQKAAASDKEKVQTLAASKSKDTKEKAARSYFGRLELGLALRTIANDLVLQPTTYRNSAMKVFEAHPEGPENYFASEKEAKMHLGQGGVHARNASDWVRENLSPKNVAYMDKWVNQYTKEDLRSQKALEKINKQQKQRAAVETQVNEETQAAKEQGEYVPTAEEAAEAAATETLVEKGKKNLQTLAYELENDLYGSDEDLLASKDVAALFNQAHPVTLDLLERGQLSRALQSMADTASSEFVRRTAETLSKIAGKTKVVYGAEESKFDPATNTAYLRAGATDYEILHEMSHAGLSHTIANPSHPVTKQLGQIFTQIKNDIDGAYGAKNLQEFVAEAWSNEDFRQHLKEKYAPGNKMSVWDKIMNVVRRMLGYPPKAQESVLDNVDRMLNEIVSPAPEMRNGDSLYAQAIQHPNLAQKAMSKVDEVIQTQQVMTPQRAAEWVGKAENMGIGFRTALQKFLNLSALAQVGNKYVGRDAITFADRVNEMAGYYENLMNKLKPLVDREEAFARTDRYQFWSTLVNDSTVEDVNPAANRSNYEGSPEKLAAWDQLNRRYNTLTDTEKKLYNDHFSAFKALFKELKAAIRGSLNQTFRNEDGSPDDARISSAYEKIMDKITKMGIDHYSPLYRSGTFWLTYTDKNTSESVSKLFASEAERRLERTKLEAEGHTGFDEPVRMDQMKSKSVPRGTVAADIVKIMKDGNAEESAIDAFYQLIISAMPETSVLKSFQKRKNTPGYVDDAALAFTNVSSNMARQLSRMKYSEELNRLIDDMRKTVGTSRGKDALRGAEIVEELEARRNFAMNPTLSDISRYASTGAFYFNLAGNVSSAAVNLLQTPMATLPQLGGEYGFGAAGRALIAATKLYGSSGLTRKVTDINDQESVERAMYSVENLVSNGKATQYAPLVNRLKELGFLQNTTMRQALEASNRGEINKGESSSLMNKTTQVATFLFHHAERANREVTALATYDLEMERLKNPSKMTAEEKKLTPEQKQAQAIEKAVRMVEFTHGASHTESAPSIGQNDIGKILTVFKRFGFMMYYMLFDTAMRALPVKGATGKELEGIQAARRQLVGIYGMAGLFAGVKGLPLYWVAELAYNALNDDDEDDFDAVMRKYLGELPFKGPVNYFTNLGIADRVGWTDLIYRENKGDKADASALSQYVESILGAPYAVVNSMYRAKQLASEGHMERAIEAGLPIGLRNILKGGRYYFEGANTLRGDPVMGEINGYNSAMQVLGFAPADLMAQYEENAYAKKKGDVISGMEKKYLKQYYVAERMGDYERADELRQKLYDLGDKYPELKITEATITKSVKNRDRISEDMYHGVQLNKKLRPLIERDIAELRD
jgi:hypothetical protein